MTWYAENTECEFFGPEFASNIRSIGWLDQAKDFETGKTPELLYKSLQELFQKSYLPMAAPGLHICNLCQHAGEAGTQILLIPSSGVLYVCPDLILHYMNAHWYKPPESFCQAVLECPPPDSMEYKRRLLENGGRKLVQNKVISW